MPAAKNITPVSVEQMDTHHSQPLLFSIGDFSEGVIELYPSIWGELEKFILGEEKERLEALNKISELRAARFSPLVIYLLTTKLLEPNVQLRSRIVEELGKILLPDHEGNLPPDDVRECLKTHMSQMRTRQLYAILQVLIYKSDLITDAARLLNYCPYAGNHLADVASSRQIPIEIRRQAVLLIGEVGYLDALPALERLLLRLESRLNGQHSMPFAPPIGSEDTDLISDITHTLRILRST